ncbi:MAG: ABC transporter permease [Rhodospirillales bacterium]|nr:ABC transporter permease [Rhodospirillales bacterium]
MPETLQPIYIRSINVIGLLTLIKREIDRFMNVYLQTIVAPVITTLLFYTVFALAFGGVARQVGDVPFLVFLAPGLIMMTMVQNAFANTSSSLVIAKVQGSIVDILLPPLSAFEMYAGFIIGAVVRGLMVGTVTGVVMSLFVEMAVASWGLVVVYALLGTIMLGSLGMAAGIWAEKFDHVAAVTNFLVTPLTFLSGTFYSVEALPEMWRGMAHYNPFFYMIDGFRAGFIGQADGNIWIGIAVLAGINMLLAGFIYMMLRTGYKIKT